MSAEGKTPKSRVKHATRGPIGGKNIPLDKWHSKLTAIDSRKQHLSTVYPPFTESKETALVKASHIYSSFTGVSFPDSKDFQDKTEEEEDECDDESPKVPLAKLFCKDSVTLDRICCKDDTAIVRRIRQGLPFKWAVSSANGTNTSIVLTSGIAADCSGNVYVCGNFSGTIRIDGAILTSAFITPFIAKLDCNGCWKLVQIPSITADATIVDITVDRCGNVYAVGSFTDTIQWGTTRRLVATDNDTWVVKMKPNGRFVNVEQAMDIAGAINPSGIAVDASESVYITGNFIGTISFGGHILTGVNFEVFIAKLSPRFMWVWANKSTNSTGFISPSAGIEVDGSGSLFVSGFFNGSVTFAGPPLVTQPGVFDMFVARASTYNGTWIRAVQSNSTAPGVIPSDLTIDCRTGTVYVTGAIEGPSLGPVFFGPTEISITNPNSQNVTFVSSLSNNLDWLFTVAVPDSSSTLNENLGTGIATDIAGNIYVTGTYHGMPTFGNLTVPPSEISTTYIAKMTPKGCWVAVNVTVNRRGFAVSKAIATAPQSDIYVVGDFVGLIQFGDKILSNLQPRQTMYVTKLHDDQTNRLFGTVGCEKCKPGWTMHLSSSCNTDEKRLNVLWRSRKPQKKCLSELLDFNSCVKPAGVKMEFSLCEFKQLIPSFDYYLNRAGELVVGCVKELCADPSLVYYGTACSTTTLLVRKKKKGCHKKQVCCPPERSCRLKKKKKECS